MLTASSCGGDEVVVTVVSSKRPGRGPYKCVRGHYGYPDELGASCSFNLTFRYEPRTTYYIAVGAASYTQRPPPNAQLRLAVAEAQPEPPQPAPLGTWPNPRTIPSGQAGLPFLSEQLSVSDGWWAFERRERSAGGG